MHPRMNVVVGFLDEILGKPVGSGLVERSVLL
jgi:hypothetical protein